MVTIRTTRFEFKIPSKVMYWWCSNFLLGGTGFLSRREHRLFWQNFLDFFSHSTSIWHPSPSSTALLLASKCITNNTSPVILLSKLHGMGYRECQSVSCKRNIYRPYIFATPCVYFCVILTDDPRGCTFLAVGLLQLACWDCRFEYSLGAWIF